MSQYLPEQLSFLDETSNDERRQNMDAELIIIDGKSCILEGFIYLLLSQKVATVKHFANSCNVGDLNSVFIKLLGSPAARS